MRPPEVISLLKVQAAAAAHLANLQLGPQLHSVCRASQLLAAVLEQSAEALDGRRDLNGPHWGALLDATLSLVSHARAEQKAAQS